MPRSVAIDDVATLVGQPVGPGPWHSLTQDQINLFADATGDHQWIHVDPERAKSGPFGRTVAHGFLTLALIPDLVFELLEVTGASLVVNYGVNKVRFPAPVPAGSQVRGAVELLSAGEVSGGIQAVYKVTVEVEGSPKPGCAAELVLRYYRADPAGPASPAS